MKVNNNTLQELADLSQAEHTIKVDYKKLEQFQIPEREPDPVKVTKELMKYLEQLPLPEQNGIKVDYKQLEEFECPNMVSYSSPVFIKRFAMAACLLFTLLSATFFAHTWVYTQTKEPNVVEADGTITITNIPFETLEPVITPNPVVTEEPVVTETPIMTKKPVITKEPVGTPKPTPKPVVKKRTKKDTKKVSKDGWVSLGNGWLITRYCPLSCCNGKYAGRTSTGAKMKVNHTIAVDPSVIPYGTHVKIEGLNYEFVAEDCGGKVKGKHIDVLVKNCKVAEKLGKSGNVKVWIKK